MSKYWTEVRHQNIPISGPALKIQAQKFADQLKISYFLCSYGIFSIFKFLKLVNIIKTLI